MSTTPAAASPTAIILTSARVDPTKGAKPLPMIKAAPATSDRLWRPGYRVPDGDVHTCDAAREPPSLGGTRAEAAH